MRAAAEKQRILQRGHRERRVRREDKDSKKKTSRDDLGRSRGGKGSGRLSLGERHQKRANRTLMLTEIGLAAGPWLTEGCLRQLGPK
jgi:hypothetical protein